MPVVAVLLVLISAVMHATWNALARRTGSPYGFFFAFNLLAALVWLPVALAAGWNLRLSGPDFLLIAGSGALQVLYFALLAGAYSRGGLTLVYPVARGTGVAIVPLAGYVLFDERPTLTGWIGIAATLAGLAILAFGAWRGRGNPDASLAAIVFALLTGLVISSYSLLDNFGVTRINPIVYGYGLIVAAVVIQAPYALTRKSTEILRELRSNRRSVIAGSILSMGTYMLVLIALTGSNVGYVVPLRETSIAFAVVIGMIFLREQISRVRVFAALIIVASALCIAIGG